MRVWLVWLGGLSLASVCLNDLVSGQRGKSNDRSRAKRMKRKRMGGRKGFRGEQGDNLKRKNPQSVRSTVLLVACLKKTRWHSEPGLRG